MFIRIRSSDFSILNATLHLAPSDSRTGLPTGSDPLRINIVDNTFDGVVQPGTYTGALTEAQVTHLATGTSLLVPMYLFESVVLPDTQQPITLEFPPTVAIRATVPLTGGQTKNVEVSGRGPTFGGPTDRHGQFVVLLSPGVYMLAVEDAPLQAIRVDVSPSDTGIRDIRLRA